ncbi:MAG: type II secretion system F family protein [Phycisphaeraceae bacterium]|nr:type II secretion system F family protein [Phycisphaeraceae bacterium]
MSALSSSNSFFYMAVRPGGGRKFGIRQAGNVPALAQSLRIENKLLVRSWKLPTWASPSDELSVRDQATLNEQLGQLLSRGVPLVEALEVASATVRPSARPRVNRMRELVAAGSSFSDACRQVGGFDSVTIAVYRGAERTGDLAGAAKELNITLRRRLAVAGKAATLMVYPVIVLCISAAVTLLMLMLIVPRLSEALLQADVDLPTYSKVVMGVGVAMRDNAWVVMIALAALAAAALVGRGLLKRFGGWLMRRLPLLREVVLAQESARFFGVMGAMTRTGVPFGDALAVANQAVTHPQMRGQLERLRQKLIGGGLLRTLIDEVTTLPLATRRLLIAAERSGDLEHAFTTLAQDMADEVDKKSARALAALEPSLIVFMFVVIGSLLMSILLPMLTLTSRVAV